MRELLLFLCCLTSTEAGWPIRDGDRVGKRARVIGSTAETARKRPERPWTAARTMEVLRRCPLAIAQRLVHCAIALSTAVLDRVTKTMSVAPLLTNNLDNSKQKMSNLLSPAPPPYSWSLLGKSEGPAPPPSSKISWSFDLAWNPELLLLLIALYSAILRSGADSLRCVACDSKWMTVGQTGSQICCWSVLYSAILRPPADLGRCCRMWL